MLKSMALKKANEKIDAAVQTSLVETASIGTQTTTPELTLSPIKASEQLDWHYVNDTDCDASSVFGIQKFEESLKFPESSYSLGVVVTDESGKEADKTIDNLAKGLGIASTQQLEDSKNGYSFLDTLSTVNERPKSIYEELLDVGENPGQMDKLKIHDQPDVEQVKDRSYSPPTTRSRGVVPVIQNVQEKILEYERRTEAKRKSSYRE